MSQGRGGRDGPTSKNNAWDGPGKGGQGQGRGQNANKQKQCLEFAYELASIAYVDLAHASHKHCRVCCRRHGYSSIEAKEVVWECSLCAVSLHVAKTMHMSLHSHSSDNASSSNNSRPGGARGTRESQEEPGGARKRLE